MTQDKIILDLKDAIKAYRDLKWYQWIFRTKVFRSTCKSLIDAFDKYKEHQDAYTPEEKYSHFDTVILGGMFYALARIQQR